ncbi:uncharacterized protein LOC106080277 isoform X2 [Biomphalaria glabrata]|uniref:Uncharacterized protein LOC106080277 isoform X2 n=1 Tax=Biomphalaria glabrata TaxID=6526 RepID=A0A9W2YFI8_BIOGL|nr:uncharacterized protein LOC106080277 isoform X2 [Biomphalaria glabrata]XP_055861492.1 uncharacterized protein LOC106080277 isoform X2 [Biomphalaria glabrata]KAI8749129.1 CAunnamed protein product [Biomphalaria glabrata]
MTKVIKSTLEVSPTKETPRMKGWKKFIHILAFLFLVGNDIADFISDWLFWAEVRVVGKGIVYGEPDQAAVWALLAFCIVGTITFIFEIVNLWWESFRGNPWIDSDLLSAVVIWIEDIPQVAISMYLVLCREEPISVFQLVKASVIIIGIFIRIIVSLVKYCNKEAIRSHHHVKYKVCIMLGMIIEAACAVAIFVLTQTERDGSGTVSFRVPTTIIDDQLDDQRYFGNVSIFASHAYFFNQGQLDPDKKDSVVNWIRLTTINKLRSSPNKELNFRIQFEQIANILKMAIWEKLAAWTLVVCYNVDISIASIQNVTNTTCAATNYFNDPVNAFIKFRYEEPSSMFKKNVLGEIYVNMKLNQSGQCTPYSDYRSTIEESLKDQVNMTLHYYRTVLSLLPTDTNHMKHNGTQDPTFFKNIKSDMTDVSEVWRTGWMECEATGHVGPVLDQGVELNCSMT